MAKYTYNSNNGALNTLTYGTGQKISYGYDVFGNTKSIKYNGNTAFNFYTDRNGKITRSVDSINDIQYNSVFDTTGRLVRTTANSTTAESNKKFLYSTEYGYDLNNNITKLINKTPNATITNNYTYGKDNLLTKYKMTAGYIANYTYDGLNRLTKVSVDTNSPIDTSYTYYDSAREDGNYTTNLLEAETIGGVTYEYSYDTLGNITDIYRKDGDKLKTLYNYEYYAIGNPLTYRDGIEMIWKNGRELDTFTKGTTNVSYSYDSNSVRVSKTVDGVKYTYEYLNGKLLYETRGEAKFWYSYDSNGILYNIRYTLSDNSAMMSYYCTHNSRGDIVGIYNGDGVLRAQYKYDSWGNVLSVTDENGNAIISATHVGNLNPFRYRGYYQDTETGLYYLMSRYYDAVTHRFINADGYFQSGTAILDGNTFAYCANNPIYSSDPTGAFWGIVAGFCSGFISNTICQMISGTDISEINWGSALISGLTGAALGAVDVLGIGSIAGACIKGGISFFGSFADSVCKGNDFGTAVGGATVDGLTSLGFSSITRDLGGSHFSQEAVTKRKNWNFAASVGEKAYQYVRGSTSSVGESTGTGYKPAPKKQTQCRSCGRPIGKKYAWQCKYPTYY